MRLRKASAKAPRSPRISAVALASSEGRLLATKFAREGAGLLTSLTQSDGFAELPEAVTEVAPGDRVMVLPFGGML